MVTFRRGDTLDVDLGDRPGTTKTGKRPCVVVQNDIGNEIFPFTIVVPITDRKNRKKLYRGDVEIKAPEGGLDIDSVADCAQIAVIDKRYVVRRRGSLANETMAKIDEELKLSLSLR